MWCPLSGGKLRACSGLNAQGLIVPAAPAHAYPASMIACRPVGTHYGVTTLLRRWAQAPGIGCSSSAATRWRRSARRAARWRNSWCWARQVACLSLEILEAPVRKMKR